MHSSLHALPVLQDNVIWVWARGTEAVVIDPAVAPQVQDWLEDRQLNLAAVLQTHHHRPGPLSGIAGGQLKGSVADTHVLASEDAANQGADHVSETEDIET